VGVGIGKFLFVYVLKTFSPRKVYVFGVNFHVTLCSGNGLNSMMG